MITQSDFAGFYKKMSNFQLMEILEKPAGYQAVAIQAARQELEKRQLSDDEILEVRQELNARLLSKEKLKERNEIIREKLVGAGNAVYDTLNPVQQISPTVNKTIWIIGIIFGLEAVLSLARDFDLLTYIITGETVSVFEFAVILFPILLLFFGVAMLLLRKQTGWVLLVFYCSYSLFPAARFLVKSISRIISGGEYGGYFYQPAPFNLILTLLLYLATIFVLSKANMRERFKINGHVNTAAILAGLSVGALLIFI